MDFHGDRSTEPVCAEVGGDFFTPMITPSLSVSVYFLYMFCVAVGPWER